jgi:hypothetical protein
MNVADQIREWRLNPLKFVLDVFKVEPDNWQAQTLTSLGGDPNPMRRLAMRSCTGAGKSSLIAWIGWQRLLCYATKGEHPKGAALAITKDNLQDNLWAELSKWQQRSKLLMECFNWTKSIIAAKEHPETWFLSARSFAKDADQESIGRALSGLHSKFPFILLDETGDMPQAVGRAAEQIFTGAPIDALIAGAGNPTSSNGLLYEMVKNGKYKIVTVTADPEDENRTSRVSVEIAQEQIDEYGRDNPWVMATILGLFPPSGFNNLIGLDAIEESLNRSIDEHQYSFAAKVISVDVAREGDDASVITCRQGMIVHEVKSFRNMRSFELATAAKTMKTKYQGDAIIVDGTGGYGGGVIDALEQMREPAIDCQFAGKPDNPRYFNKRAEIYFKMVEWFNKGGVLHTSGAGIKNELPMITYSYKGDRLLIESKEQLKKRLGKSPDLSDSLATSFAVDIAPRDQIEEYLLPDKEWDPFDGL